MLRARRDLNTLLAQINPPLFFDQEAEAQEARIIFNDGVSDWLAE